MLIEEIVRFTPEVFGVWNVSSRALVGIIVPWGDVKDVVIFGCFFFYIGFFGGGWTTGGFCRVITFVDSVGFAKSFVMVSRTADKPNNPDFFLGESLCWKTGKVVPEDELELELEENTGPEGDDSTRVLPLSSTGSFMEAGKISTKNILVRKKCPFFSRSTGKRLSLFQ